MESKYYNEEFKNQYLNDGKIRNKNIEKTVGLLFRRIAPQEEMLGKDLYDFTVTEILNFYKYLFTSSLESIMIMNNQYKLYTAYALKRGMVKDNQNHYAEMDSKTLQTCVHTSLLSSKIITRTDLIDILTSSGVENISDRVIALAIFEGISGRNMTELTHLEPTDINPQTKTVKLFGGRELEITDKLIDWCMESANEYEFFNDSAKKQNKRYLETDTRVIKRLSNSTVDTDLSRHKTINRRLDYLISVTNCNAFTIGALKESGRQDMIKEKMEKKKISVEEALKDKEIIYKYGKVPSIKRYIMKYDLV